MKYKEKIYYLLLNTAIECKLYFALQSVQVLDTGYTMGGTEHYDRIALVHCRLYPGGGQQVFCDLIETFSFERGLVFSVVGDRRMLQTKTHRLRVVYALPWWMCQIFSYCSRHQIFILSSLFDYRNLIVIYPLLVWILSLKIRRYHPDHAFISSFAVSKNVSIGCPKTLYIHSPMQYIWDNYDEYISKFHGWKRYLFVRVSRYLRVRDMRYRAFDAVYANSQYTGRLVQKYYHLNAKVLYPQVEKAFIDAHIQQHEHYYVFVGRLVSFVRECDRIIALFNETGHKLLMIGSGPDEDLLKAKAKSNIQFVGHISDVDTKYQMIAKARGLINIAKESFGLNTVEALLCGVPVLGFAGGATPELFGMDDVVENRVSKDHKHDVQQTPLGILVKNKSHATLIRALQLFDRSDFDHQLIRDTIIRQLSYNP